MKKPRRSERLSQQLDGHDGEDGAKKTHLPSPVTRKETSTSTDTDQYPHRATKSPSPSQKELQRRTPASSPAPQGLQSPPNDTQAYSQFITPAPYSYEVEDEEGEGVWGYLVPLSGGPNMQNTMVLRRRSACPKPDKRAARVDGKHRVGKEEYKEMEEDFENSKVEKGVPAGGYLIGRHPECGKSPLKERVGSEGVN